MSDFNLTFNDDIRPILMGAKNAQGLYRKNSVSALAKDLILQYPVLISADIDYDTAVIISKALELQFASLQVLVLSADTAFGVDPMKNAGVRDLLSKYHSNSDTPNLINYAGNLIYNAGHVLGTLVESADITEETNVRLKKVTEQEQTHSDEFLNSLWVRANEEIESSTLNELYSPANAILQIVTEAANAAEYSVAKATEDLDDLEDYIESRASGETEIGPKQFNAARLPKDAQKDLRYKVEKQPNGARIMKIEKDFTKLEPTMLELEFFIQNGENSRAQKAVIGVAAMPRAIPSDVVRSNIIKSLQHSHTGFKFIQYTRGEMKVVKDFIFNVSNIREDALAKSKYDKWFAALRKRKQNAKAFKGGGATINPLTSLVITKNDAAMIKQTSNFDLTDENQAIRLMDSLYLLCLVIVDTDTGLVSTLLDGQKYFVETTIDSLKKSNNAKGNDIMNTREILKLMGR